jgi:hypothetical protein
VTLLCIQINGVTILVIRCEIFARDLSIMDLIEGNWAIIYHDDNAWNKKSRAYFHKGGKIMRLHVQCYFPKFSARAPYPLFSLPKCAKTHLRKSRKPKKCSADPRFKGRGGLMVISTWLTCTTPLDVSANFRPCEFQKIKSMCTYYRSSHDFLHNLLQKSQIRYHKLGQGLLILSRL